MTGTALVVVDDEHGNGHLVRGRALASELCSRGWRVETTNQLGPVEVDLLIVDGQMKWPQGHEAKVACRTAKVVGILDFPQGLQGWDLVVCGTAHDGAWGRPGDLVGPRYAILRPEFAKWGALKDIARTTPLLDVRNIDGRSANDLAEAMRRAQVVLTYAGMRAMEAACCGADLALMARNEGETLNAIGLLRARRPVIDGLGCKRVADQLETLCQA